MHRYSLYGLNLASELEFPQLQSSNGNERADWTLRVRESPAQLTDAVLLGEERIQHIGNRLWRHSEGYRMEYDDTGMFDVSADGHDLYWFGSADVDADLRFVDFSGRVLAIALHLMGKLTLHGSAAVLGDQGIAFLAPKGSGKSTIAMSLAAAGGRLASDDMVTLEPGEPVEAWPGPASLRLWRHTADALGLDYLTQTIGAGAKQTLSQLPSEMVMSDPFRLSAIYILTPVTGEGSDPAVERILLDPMSAALALVPNNKIGSLFDATDSAIVLKRIASITKTVPVYQLRVLRDFARLTEVVEQMFVWHGAVPSDRSVCETP